MRSLVLLVTWSYACHETHLSWDPYVMRHRERSFKVNWIAFYDDVPPGLRLPVHGPWMPGEVEQEL